MFRPLAITAALAWLAPSLASAEPPRPHRASAETPRPDRDGLFVGAAYGVSRTSSPQYEIAGDLGPALDVSLGHMLTRELGTFVEIGFGVAAPPIGHEVDQLTFKTLRAGLAFWPLSRLRLGATAGIGQLVMSERVSTCPRDEPICFDFRTIELGRELGLSGAAGLGVELYRRESFVLDLDAALHATATSDTTLYGSALRLGIRWY